MNKEEYARCVELHICSSCRKPLPDDYKLKRCKACYLENANHIKKSREKNKHKKKQIKTVKIINLEALSKYGFRSLETCYVKELKGNYVLRVIKKTGELKCWNWVNGKIKDPTPHIQDLIKAGIVR